MSFVSPVVNYIDTALSSGETLYFKPIIPQLSEVYINCEEYQSLYLVRQLMSAVLKIESRERLGLDLIIIIFIASQNKDSYQ